GCQRCHLKDGRGHPPSGPDDSAVSMFLRLSIPPQSDADRERLVAHRASTIPEPTYGGQLQDIAIAGRSAEGRMVIAYEELPVELAGGEVVRLRKPRYEVEDLAYGPLHPQTMLSPRVAPPMIGLGLLEAIAPEDIVARADADDADGDGISGRANRVWSNARQQVMLGRFGWKAGKASIADQSADAFAGDVGISSALAPDAWGDCTEAQAECRAGPHGDDDEGVEIGAEAMHKVVFYSSHLAVPERRNVADPNVLRGKALFYRSGCIACHTPKHATRSDWPEESLAGQLIWPYTDLLLHDMGEGLADGRPEGDASGREWRTAPLWGIGLTETVNGHSYFLHDGRARNLLEAVLWHGGEAQAARDAVQAMRADDRQALLDFLESL
ncbi:MAG: di-heme oxidoredictase family protein, partial [Gammaproteobacteria bacterium]|nr:di-heme oxidoredictase family protein [Gammaproteobacteria bacterium]